jgi:hypothetical protein
MPRLDFHLFKTFRNRLVFGMSLSPLRNDLAKIYEPTAPAPTQRLATLRAESSPAYTFMFRWLLGRRQLNNKVPVRSGLKTTEIGRIPRSSRRLSGLLFAIGRYRDILCRGEQS